MADDKIVYEIVFEDGEATLQLKKLEKKASDAGKKSGETFSENLTEKIKSGFSSIQGQLVSIGLGIASAFTFKRIIKEATDAENALNDFTSALKVSGQFSQFAIDDFKSFASSLQDVTTAGDDAIIQNASLLVSLGKLSGQGLKDATRAALDLAAGLNKDVSFGFETLAKAATGNVGILARYGIKVKETGDASADFAKALALIRQQFDGLAASKVNTFSGAIAQLENRVGDFFETLGEFITKNPDVINAINVIADRIKSFTAEVGKFDFNAFIQKTKNAFITLGAAITSVFFVFKSPAVLADVVKFFTTISGSVAATSAFVKTQVIGMASSFSILRASGAGVFESIALTAKTALASIKATSVGVKLLEFSFVALKAAATLGLTLILDAAINKILELKDQGFTLGQIFKLAGYNLLIGINEAIQKSAGLLANLAGKIGLNKISEGLTEISVNAGARSAEFKSSIDLMTDSVKKLGDESEKAKNKVNSSVASTVPTVLSVGQAFQSVADGIKISVAELTKDATAGFVQVGKTMAATLAGGAANAFAALGKSLVKGGNGIKAFVDSFLGTIGQLAIQLGTQFILMGAAGLFLGPKLAAAVGILNPGALIAAGAALAAFGGVLSAVGDSGGSSQGTSSGGAAGATDVGSTVSPIDQAQQDEIKQKRNGPSIVVNIDRVLNRKEEAEDIASLINEFVENGGGSIRTQTA